MSRQNAKPPRRGVHGDVLSAYRDASESLRRTAFASRDPGNIAALLSLRQVRAPGGARGILGRRFSKVRLSGNPRSTDPRTVLSRSGCHASSRRAGAEGSLSGGRVGQVQRLQLRQVKSMDRGARDPAAKDAAALARLALLRRQPGDSFFLSSSSASSSTMSSLSLPRATARFATRRPSRESTFISSPYRERVSESALTLS